MYYIDKITIVSNNGNLSSINLENGLNIICGESNTGKSLIVDCINYMYGAKKHRFDDKLNIREIIMSIYVDGQHLGLSRELDSSSVFVESDVENIKSGIYTTGSSGSNLLNDVWMKLLGINKSVKIASTLEGKAQRLTYRTFSHIFLIDEEEIIKMASILASKNSRGSQVPTAVLSALIYLATEQTYLPDREIKTKQIRDERKDAVKSFVNRSLFQINQNSSYKKFESNKSPRELKYSIDLLLQEIETNKGILKEQTDLRQKVVNKILELTDEINQCNVLYNRNINLATQYASDIKRLTFIAEGDLHSNDIPKLDHCPFCNGELRKNQSESCVDAAIVEVRKIEKQIEDLKSVQESILKEINDLSNEQTNLIEEKKAIEQTIQNELKPKISKLKSQLNEYTISLNHAKTVEITNDISNILLSELRNIVDEESNATKIEIPEYFKNIFQSSIEKQLDSLLKECKYKNYLHSSFEMPIYDIVINGQSKKSQGKGFRSYLNTLVAIAFQNHLIEHGMHIPRILVIDSPILTLKEKEDHAKNNEQVSDTMKVGLFKYLVEHQDNRQIIVVENDIPDIDYKNTKIIRFTKDINNGRYGLLSNFND